MTGIARAGKEKTLTAKAHQVTDSRNIIKQPLPRWRSTREYDQKNHSSLYTPIETALEAVAAKGKGGVPGHRKIAKSTLSKEGEAWKKE